MWNRVFWNVSPSYTIATSFFWGGGEGRERRGGWSNEKKNRARRMKHTVSNRLETKSSKHCYVWSKCDDQITLFWNFLSKFQNRVFMVQLLLIFRLMYISSFLATTSLLICENHNSMQRSYNWYSFKCFSLLYSYEEILLSIFSVTSYALHVGHCSFLNWVAPKRTVCW